MKKSKLGFIWLCVTILVLSSIPIFANEKKSMDSSEKTTMASTNQGGSANSSEMMTTVSTNTPEISTATTQTTSTDESTTQSTPLQKPKNKWEALLLKYKGNKKVNDLIFVKYKGSSKAEVLYYKKKSGTWKKMLSCKGYVGKKGINKKKEGDKKTPTGTFCITGAFGIKQNPGAKISYTKVTSSLYWCGDKKYYNQLVDVKKKPHKCSGEHLIRYKGYYDYGLFLDFNKEGKFKKGSAIFMHCKKKNSYTAGCIAVSKTSMKKIIQNIDKGTKICIYKK